MFTYSILKSNIALLDGYKSLENVPLICSYCAETYYRTKHYLQRELPRAVAVNNYCSRACTGAASQRRKTITCDECGESIVRKNAELAKGKRSFCSNSCSAIFYNREKYGEDRKEKAKERARDKAKIYNQKIAAENRKSKPTVSRSKYTNEEERIEAARTRRKINEDKKNNVWGPYCKIFLCTCAHSGLPFVSRSPRKYSPEFAHMYCMDRVPYHFTFNVYNYPDLFDIEMIEEIGWYNTCGGKWSRHKEPNPDGVSRDHIISVADALKYGYDPYYIKHPLNCQIMLQKENSSKKTRSDMLYEDLVQQVDAYEANKSKSFATIDLPSSTISTIAAQTMDPRHDHLNDLL